MTVRPIILRALLGHRLLLGIVLFAAILLASGCQTGPDSARIEPYAMSDFQQVARPASPEEPVEASEPAVRQATIQVNAPRWRVGDRWQYSDGYGLVVEDVEGPMTRFRRLDDPTQWHVRYGFLRERGQSATTRRRVLYRTVDPDQAMTLSDDQALVFQREFESNNRQLLHATSWTVEGRERIRVPAGTFDCILIVMRTRNVLSNWTGFERWWYSPKIRNYVRMEYRYGDQPIRSRVLVSHGNATSTELRRMSENRN